MIPGTPCGGYCSYVSTVHIFCFECGALSNMWHEFRPRRDHVRLEWQSAEVDDGAYEQTRPCEAINDHEWYNERGFKSIAHFEGARMKNISSVNDARNDGHDQGSHSPED